MLNCTDVNNKLKELLDVEKINSVVLSNPIKKTEQNFVKVNVKPIMLRDKLTYQFSMLKNNKMYHKNVEPNKFIDEILDMMEQNFKQCNIQANYNLTLLMNKKKLFTITGLKKNDNTVSIAPHNKEKRYILKDGVYVDWLYQLGIMDKNGVVHNQKQKKFRQINKFVEMLKDIEKYIPDNSIIIDMGCGKSYLTFAIYHYFNLVKNKNVEIRGYDLKKDVVDNCNKLASDFGFSNLNFFAEDIANIENTDDRISMIITLHACDTATDYAIYHGIRWGCKVIMNVPCCQHELFHQIKNDSMSVILDNGILKERFSALLTDGIRARILELMGYNANVFEFIDMEHTPKNIMIRSVKTNKKIDQSKRDDLDAIIKEYNIMPTLYKLCFTGKL